jgi:thermopsin
MGVLIVLIMLASSFSGISAANGARTSLSGVQSPTNGATTSGQGQTSSSQSTFSTYSSRLQQEKSILGDLEKKGIRARDIHLPNIAGSPSSRNGPGVPYSNVAPAPMGLGDYGVINTTGTPKAYTYNTPSFKATESVNNISALYLQDGEPAAFTMQMNTVLYNVTLGQSTSNGSLVNDFWIQNVPWYDISTHELYMVDNIWNFSSTNMALTAGTLVGNGTLVAPEYYWDEYPGSAQLNEPITVAPPFTMTVYNNASTVPAIDSPWGTISTETDFGFTLTSPNLITYPDATGTLQTGHSLSMVYDKVFFHSTSSAASLPPPGYRVSGTTCAYANGAFCLPDDAEITTAIGPGGGSTTAVYGINSTLQLQYWSGSAYVNVRSAWDVGSETGETTMGVSEWWTTPGVVNLGAGPSIIYPMWNESGPTSTAGSIRVAATIDPSNAFVFVSPPGLPATPGYMAWAPGPMSGDTITYNLPDVNGASTSFSGAVMMSNHDPQTFTITTATTTLVVSLAFDITQGVYTPLFAFNNAQLANISVSGAGTLSSPYELFNDSAPSINGSFSSFNDYLFPDFPGTMLVNTTAYVDANGTTTWYMNYADPWLTQLVDVGFPSWNNLPFETYDASNVSIWRGADLTGWNDLGNGWPDGSVVFWNTTHSLVGNSTFQGMGYGVPSIYLYDPASTYSNNTIWGNSITPSTTFSLNTFYWGMNIFAGGTLIYNNIVEVSGGITAYSPAFDPNTGAPDLYINTWNVSFQPAASVLMVNGYNLTGNILGYTWQGGNHWSDYYCGSGLPYTGNGWINGGGDYLPLGCLTAYTITFSQSGLPFSGMWDLQFNYTTTYFWSASMDITITVMNGTYPFTVWDNSGVYVAVPSSGNVIVNGADVYVPILFELPMFNVTFEQSGLPSGLSWSVTVNSSTSSSSTPNTDINFTENNGMFWYDILAPAGYVASPTSGIFTMNSASFTILISFTAVPSGQEVVMFNESGAPFGGNWSVTMGGVLGYSFGPTIVFTEPLGTYSFIVGNLSGYTSTPPSGSVAVTGSALEVFILFSPVPPGYYAVTFAETGLLTGTEWSVGISGETLGFNGPNITLVETNGSYGYTVNSPAGYTASPSSGTADVYGLAVVVYVAFTGIVPPPTLYAFTFTETGLAGNTAWSATLNGLTESSATSTIVFNEPNGTYTYAIGGVTGYVASPTSGTQGIDGAPAGVAITFTAVYSVTFGETGLPAGTSWSVLVDLTTLSSTSSSITASYQNGTYTYVVLSPSGYTANPALGLVTVNGAVITVIVVFTKTVAPPTTKYQVTFNETGLAAGTSWSVSLNGTTGSSDSSLISFMEPNGTYTYAIGNVAGYAVANATGGVDVHGGAAEVTVAFTATYSVIFGETGLPAGTSWSVSLSGVKLSSTSDVITFTLASGTYDYTVNAPTGYSASTASGSVVVSGATVTVIVAFSKVITPVTPAYLVTFTETGLPAGTSWSVSLNGTTSSSTSSSITFTERNGTYAYLISVPAGYSTSPTSGSILVSGTTTALIGVTAITPTTGTTTSFLGMYGNDGYIVIALIAAVVVVAALLLMVLMRKPRGPAAATTIDKADEKPAGGTEKK